MQSNNNDKKTPKQSETTTPKWAQQIGEHLIKNIRIDVGGDAEFRKDIRACFTKKELKAFEKNLKKDEGTIIIIR